MRFTRLKSVLLTKTAFPQEHRLKGNTPKYSQSEGRESLVKLGMPHWPHLSWERTPRFWQNPLQIPKMPEAWDEQFKDAEGNFTTSLKLSNAHPLWSSSPTLLGIYPTDIHRHERKDVRTRFQILLVCKSNSLETTEAPLKRRLNKLWSVSAMKCQGAGRMSKPASYWYRTPSKRSCWTKRSQV